MDNFWVPWNSSKAIRNRIFVPPQPHLLISVWSNWAKEIFCQLNSLHGRGCMLRLIFASDSGEWGRENHWFHWDIWQNRLVEISQEFDNCRFTVHPCEEVLHIHISSFPWILFQKTIFCHLLLLLLLQLTMGYQRYFRIESSTVGSWWTLISKWTQLYVQAHCVHLQDMIYFVLNVPALF